MTDSSYINARGQIQKEMDRKATRKQNKRIATFYMELLQIKLAQETDRTQRYQIQAELEDISEGHWVGPRIDEPPANWQD